MINFYKINNFLALRFASKVIFTLDSYEEQKEILEEVYQKYYKDTYFDRSFAQYVCQKKLYKREHSFFNVISLFLIFITVVFGNLNRVGKKSHFEVVYFGPLATIPKFFLESSIEVMENKIKFRYKDVHYFFKNVLYKCKGNYYFAFKVLLKMGFYRYNMEKYSVKTILVSSEYSFTSSLMTEFCERNEVAHINYMHGEKLYNIRDSFFKFHKCYIWDGHYESLFVKLKADPNQFEEVDYKSFLCLQKEEICHKKYNTYYLQLNETKEDIKKILELLEILKEKTGYLGKIRCHPRHMMEASRKGIPQNMLDDEPNLFRSLFQSHYIIAKYSTVLYEAFILQTGILVVDDILDEEIFQKLRSLDYIILQKPHRLLSDITKEVNHD